MARSSGTFTRQPPMPRFAARVDPRPDGCWLWTGVRNPKGYGRFYFEGRLENAHRAAFMMLRGPIPAGMEIDHLCRNRACVNPDHLDVVTHHENILRGRLHQASHCLNGHAWTPENSAPKGIAGKRCRQCCAERSRRWRRRAMTTGIARDETGRI